ncbi:MAG: DUF6055 domain-containing protein [Kiritimatiellia bacterium]|jgi:hypothetical protein|nr:DUF6055 domain-containing protein [Kiritimatiellia bacterium]
MTDRITPAGTLALLLVGSIPLTAIAKPYDFYANVRYPGAELREDVDIYKVKQSGRGDPKAYDRREVKWWPRKGLDIIEVQKGMPFRTWIWQSQPLKAHLVGFRGIGNTKTSKFNGDGGPWVPAVVLRLEDGRKRCFISKGFGEEDRKFIMDLYLKEMKRFQDGQDKTKRDKGTVDIRWPDNAKPGEPGTMQVESEHFIWVSGSQAGSEDDPWVDAKYPDKAKWYRDGSIECAESWWSLLEYAGNLMIYWDRKEKLKQVITVAGTKRDGHQFIEGYAGGGYGGCILKGAGGGPWAPGLWHEWGHGSLVNRITFGGGEAQADMHQCVADPNMLKGNHHVKTPWRNVFNGQHLYGFTMFYTITGDDPNWGYAWFTCLPYAQEEMSVFQAAARCGEQRGLFKKGDGIRGVGDMVGEYGARLATFDCELETRLRGAYYAPTRSWLETVDREKCIYRIPWQDAPEPYGVNIVRLVPDGGAEEFEVDFAGLHDPDLYSDWRAVIVAVGKDEIRRYSPMWNRGKMAMKCLPGDITYWLTVTAVPTALYSGRNMRIIYSGRHAYRYPWTVQLKGVSPGTPRRMPDGLDMKNCKRHANGGGWVADTAEVADTAYVGPGAMVMGKAQVRDHAIIEDLAFVGGGAVISEHARVSGRAAIEGSAKVKGYTRTWTADSGATVTDPLPLRLGAEKLHEYGLWANYAMDRDENILLEDYYRFVQGIDRGYGRRMGTNLDGYLVGEPGFVTDDGHRGFRFNGKSQYAELCPRAVDLGEITVEIVLKSEDKGNQTIFDFGGSPDNCLVLKTGRGGKAELVAMVKGKPVVDLTSSKAIARDQWAILRVEIDGIKTSLWLNGEKVAEKASAFRPCDVFPGDQKRNFVAALRTGKGHFKGVVDRVSVYHAVHENFASLPEPTRDSPRRPTMEIIEEIEKSYGNIKEMEKKIREKAQELSKPYGEYKKQVDARIKELEQRDPGLEAATMKHKEAEDILRKKKQELQKKFDALPETVKVTTRINELRQQRSELQKTIKELKDGDRKKAEEKIKALTNEERQKDRDLRPRREKYIAEGTVKMAREVGTAKIALEEARHRAMTPYTPEKLWIASFNYQAYRGYYNTSYGRYLNDHAKALFGGDQRRDDIGFLKQVLDANNSKDDWSTSVDWDWRMKQEVDGTIKDLPLQQEWIKRARGPVVTEKPEGVKSDQ